MVNQQDKSLNFDLKTELDTFARHITRKLGMREKAQVFSYLALLVIQAMELPRCSTTKPVTQKNMLGSWGILSMLTASFMHLHHLSLTSDLTKPLGIGFKDTKRTF